MERREVVNKQIKIFSKYFLLLIFFFLSFALVFTTLLLSQKEKYSRLEEEVKTNNRNIMMAKQVECTGESSFQFFMQTLWLMPTLLTLWWDKITNADKPNLEDLVNMRSLSVTISFITMAHSYTSIKDREKDGAMSAKHYVLVIARIVLGNNNGLLTSPKPTISLWIEGLLRLRGLL